MNLQIIGNDLSTIIEIHSSPDTKIELRQGFKLTLRKDDVDRKITEIKESTNVLWQLQSIGFSIRQLEATTPSRNSKEMAYSLIRIRDYADRLYNAIALSWNPGCHSSRQASLMLKDRVEASVPASKHRIKNPSPPLSFELVLASERTIACNSLWQEGYVEVIEDESTSSSLNFLPLSTRSSSSAVVRPESAIPSSSVSSTKTLVKTTEELRNMCLTIA